MYGNPHVLWDMHARNPPPFSPHPVSCTQSKALPIHIMTETRGPIECCKEQCFLCMQGAARGGEWRVHMKESLHGCGVNLFVYIVITYNIYGLMMAFVALKT